MVRLRSLCWLLAAAVMPLTAPFLYAAPADQENPLTAVPANSPIVVHIKGFERTKERLITMIKNAIPDLAAKAEAGINDGIKKALQGRELKGMEKDGPIFVVFTEIPKGGPPKLAVLVRVTKYADFRDGLMKEDERATLKPNAAGFEEATMENEPVYFVDLKKYAVITPDKEVAGQFTLKRPGMDTMLDKTIAKKMLDSDMAVYVDTTAINKEYGNEIKMAREEIQKGLEQMADQLGGANKNGMEMIKLIVGPLFQAFEDSQGLVAALDFRPEGFALNSQALVGADTKTNALLKNAKPAAMAELAKMPAGKMFYNGMLVPGSLLKNISPFLYGIAFDAESKQGKALKDAVDQIAESKPSARLDAIDVPAQGLQVWTYEDPVRAATAQLKLFESLQGGESYSSAMLKEKPTVKASAKKYRDFDLHNVSLTLDIDAMVEKSLPPGAATEEIKKQMTAMMKRMIGDSQNIWFGSDGKRFVQVAAKDWDTAKNLLDLYLDKKNTIGEQEAFKDARKHMPTDTSLVILIDVPKYATLLAEAFEPFLSLFPIPLPAGILKPAVPGTTCFTGIAVTLQPQRASFDYWLPGKAANEIYKMFIENALKGG
ncbi:MAG: hypothetical protein ACJ8FY_13915 [Gemmataceae bacterium]